MKKILTLCLFTSCVSLSERDAKVLSEMKSPVIIVSTNEGAGFDSRTLLVRDSIGRLNYVGGLIFNSLNVGDTIK